MKRGKLIVIDGTDGAGKKTQTKLLVSRLRAEGFTAKTLAFPQYHKKSAGPVENYLEGKYGKKSTDVSPYVASLFFAIDRFDAARTKIDAWLSKGYIVVLDRYVSANMGHQGTQIHDAKQRKEFFQWVADLEYNKLALPKPDLQFIFYVDPTTAYKNAAKKWKNKVTNLKKQDILESDPRHLEEAAKVYRELASFLPGTQFIDCTQTGKILSRQEIHETVWVAVKRMLDQKGPVFDFEENEKEFIQK